MFIDFTNCGWKMTIKAFNDRFRFIASRTLQNPEKCVLPTILFVNTNHSAFDDVRHRGFMLIFGWWDWSVKVGLLF